MTLPLPYLFESTNEELPERKKIIRALGEFRQEWQKITEGDDLTSIQASVGLLLNDVADKLGLSPQERHVVLGSKLLNEVKMFVSTNISPE